MLQTLPLFPWLSFLVCLSGDFMLQNCDMDFKRWYKWKSTAWVCKCFLLHLCFLLGKGEVRFRGCGREWNLRISNNWENIQNEVFTSTNSSIPMNSFLKMSSVISFSGINRVFFVFWLETLIFGYLTFAKMFQGSFFSLLWLLSA